MKIWFHTMFCPCNSSSIFGNTAMHPLVAVTICLRAPPNQQFCEPVSGCNDSHVQSDSDASSPLAINSDLHPATCKIAISSRCTYLLCKNSGTTPYCQGDWWLAMYFRVQNLFIWFHRMNDFANITLSTT